MKYRGRADIVSTILNIARGGARKTKIMYHAFLSYRQLSEYLQLLTDAGLLEYLIDSKEYRTTEQGRYFLTIYGKVSRLMTPKNNPFSDHASVPSSI